MSIPPIDTDRIDEAVLALLYLTLHRDGAGHSTWRAWKTYDWSALDRLHEQGLITDPANKAKSVALTEDGVRHCKQAFERLFVRHA
ncbi:DUF6429 family protein [uncultured Sphingomonas sp.]|uniref:DUF6429 family protein n=1 Tax=uncultured Sphingomonas sp. TaxID=158754 RepID=UPI0025DC4AD4|nr:DUF6429 family protein [uncultured Sphingomonas sp.]